MKGKINDLNAAIQVNKEKFNQLNLSQAKTAEGYAAIRKEIRLNREENALLTKNLATQEAALADTTAQIKIHTSEVKKAESTGSGFANGATKVYSGLRKLAYIIPGMGIAGLISLISGPLIDAFEEWYNSIDKVSDAQKLLKANLENYNDVNAEANKNAAKQITDLKILYDASTNVNLSMKDRLAAVKGLQNEFPDYFKNINQETILNGGAKSAYDALTDSILANARAKAALSKIQELEAKRLDALQAKQNAINDANTKNQQLVANQNKPSFANALVSQGNDYVTSLNAQIAANNLAASGIQKSQDNLIKSLEGQEDFLVKYAGLSDLAKSVETTIKPPKVAKDAQSLKEVETIEDVIKKMYAQLDVLSKKEILQNISLAPEKVKVIGKAIDELLSKFKLLTGDPHIIELQAKIDDINLTEQFKKDLKFDKNEPLPVPIDIEPKPEVVVSKGTYDETREQILEELKKRGITKTAPIQLGIDVSGKPIMTNSKFLTGFESKDVLQGTLDADNKKLQEMSKEVNEVLGPAFDALFEGILTGSQNAFQSFGEALEKTIAQLGTAVLKAAAFAAIFSLLPGSAQFGTIFFQLLGHSEGGLIKKLSSGGAVWGAGTATSDSIPTMLSSGEYVVRAARVKQFGVDFFDKLNFGNASINDILKDNNFGLAKFATGGFVSPNSVNISRPALVPATSIGNGQQFEVTGEFQLRNDRLVAAVKRGQAQISRNS